MLDFIRGIVRPILTLMGFAVASYLVIVGALSVEVYLPMVGMMVAFWFSERKSNGNGGSH